MSASSRTHERGQVLAIFAIALVAIVAMTGLVLDGGSAFVQRRDMQNVADAAAMAAAYDYVNNVSPGQAQQAARDTASANGYNHGTDATVDVQMGVGPTGGTAFTVTISRPHRNLFSGIVGMPTWDVSTTAQAVEGIPNAALGAMPLIFNTEAFATGAGEGGERTYAEPPPGGEDVPQDDTMFNWTVYCTASGSICNADSDTVDDLINNNGHSKQVDLTDEIAPLNAGSHTTLFSDMAEHVGESFPVSIVDDDGNMVGWAMFHLTASVGGSSKSITGWFEAPANPSGLYIAQGAGVGGTFGSYVVKLVN